MSGFPLFVARRHLFGGRSGAYLRGVAAITVAAVALGVAAVVVVVSVMDGFRIEVERSLLAATPHVRVRAWSGPLVDWEAAAADIRAVDGVAAAGPFVDGAVLVRPPVGDAVPVEVEGIDPAASATDVVERLAEGSWSALGETGVVVGVEFALLHGVRLGDGFALVSPRGEATEVTVVGVFRSGFYEVDVGRFYLSLAGARRAVGLAEGVSGLDVRCRDVSAAEAVAGRIEAAHPFRSGGPAPLSAVSWTRARQNLLRAMRIEKVAMFVVESFVVLVAAFNVASILTMVVTRKIREIGVLLALGATRAQVLAAFALQGLALGTFGAGLGVAGGLSVCAALRRWPLRLPGGGEVYVIEHVPVAVSAEVVAIAAAMAVAAALLAALYPARAAGNLDPAQALRHE